MMNSLIQLPGLARKAKKLRSNNRPDAPQGEEQVLLIDALYIGPRVMILGVAACVFSTIACLIQAADPYYLLFTAAFAICGLFRIRQTLNYRDNQSQRSFEQWKSLALINGVAQGLLLGLFSAYATFSHDHFNELTATCLVLGSLVGIPARNFSSKRLVAYQIIAICVPVVGAFLLQPEKQYWVIAALLLPMFLSITQLAEQSRATLLQVIRRKIEIKLLLSRFNTATEFMQHGFIIVDNTDTIVIANSRALQLLGITDSERWVGQEYQQLLRRTVECNQLASDALQQLAQPEFNSEQSSGTHKALVNLGGDTFLESSASYNNGQLVVLLEDVTTRIRTADRITYMATHDSLTGLCNREHFHDLFNQHLLERGDGQCMLAVIDLDDFKSINDTYGHAAGDELLCAAAANIERICGDYAIACRFGGDEFVVFVPQVHDPSEIEYFPEWLLTALSGKVQLTHGCIQSKASIGIVVEQHATATSDGMFAKADLALYESKARSRGTWTLYQPEMDANCRQRQRLKDELSLAVERDQLSVMFQPIVHLDSGRVQMFEALSRWHHPELGDISPAEFIPLAEEMNVVGKITQIVLKKSIAECCKWPTDISVSVNLSAIDFDDPYLVSKIDTLLTEAELAPERLEVEITEGTFIENKKRVADAVHLLQKLGVCIALDDFGTGYSNFSYLQEVSLNKLKIDRCFVNDILVNERSSLLLSGISDIAKRLDIAVTVEGIETTEQLVAVQRAADVDYVQGWVFSKAVSAAQALSMTLRSFDTHAPAQGPTAVPNNYRRAS